MSDTSMGKRPFFMRIGKCARDIGMYSAVPSLIASCWSVPTKKHLCLHLVTGRPFSCRTAPSVIKERMVISSEALTADSKAQIKACGVAHAVPTNTWLPGPMADTALFAEHTLLE